MTSSADEIVVFIASPSDLPEERAAAFRVAERVVATCGIHLGVRVRITGWEQVQPGFGRPQARINDLVDACDVFVAVLNRRWGSNSGMKDSGFEEEFDRAVGRREASGESPEIAVFLKDIPPDLEADPGPQLLKVLEFRQRIRDNHVLLYRPFDDARTFESELTNYLVHFVSELGVRRLSQSQSRSADIGGVTGDTGDERPQVAEVLDSFMQATLGNPPENLDRDRLVLFAASTYADEEPSTHIRNRIYRRRATVELVPLEASHWLRALVRDLTLRGESRTIPGWGIVGAGQQSAIYDLLSEGSDHLMKQGALEALRLAGMRPAALWSADQQEGADAAWSALFDTKLSPLKVVQYIQRVRQDPDNELLSRVAARFEFAPFRAVVQAPDADETTQTLAAAVVGTDNLGDETAAWLRVEIAKRLPEVSDDLLRRLARSQSDDVTADLRDAAVSSLAGRHVLEPQDLSVLVGQGLYPGLRAAKHAAASEDPVAWVASLLTGPDGEAPKLDDIVTSTLLAIAASEEELKEQASWSNPSVFGALLARNDADALQEARGLLGISLSDWREGLGVDETTLTAYENVLDWILHKRLVAAAHFIAALPDHLREEEDVQRLRRELLVEREYGHAIAALSLAAFGRVEDAEKIAAVANQSNSLRLGPLLAEKAMELGGPEFAISHLASDDWRLLPAAVNYLMASDDVPESALEELLHSTQAHTRVRAAHCLAQNKTRDELAELLDQYCGLEQYFYNVVAYLDSAVYLWDQG